MEKSESTRATQQIRENITVHDKIAKKYEKVHGEIFNAVEQARLRDILIRARDLVRTQSAPMRALDFGCGSGNLTSHLLEVGCDVTAADVSPGFLRLVEERFGKQRLNTLQMNGTDLRELADGSFDLIATYSVLHHVPDYLHAVAELGRVCKSGGVIVIDHEQNAAFWNDEPIYREFRKAALLPDWKKFLRPSNYVHRLRRFFNPRHTNEGDIHVFADDHIEWDRIRSVLEAMGFEVVVEEDYLLYRSLYRREVYDRYADRCSDTRVMAFRKN
jgi:ubiquinone/menaquinone biosynthesis C-methylase UbiE